MHPADRIRGSMSSKLGGKTIVLGVTGSIAAVKSIELARELIRHGADVHPVMSRDATDIVHPNALWFATGTPAVTRLDGSMDYLVMCGTGGKADLVLIAPCTANTISKLAQGIDDTTVTAYATNALGSGIPILIAPAAHESMIENPIVADNLRKLRGLSVGVVEPKQEEEKAKLADIEAIVASVLRALGPRDLAGKRVVVIAGATVEPIDDVRIVTNRSTGETGIELAKAAFERGAEVELWLGRHEGVVPPYLPTKSFDTTANLGEMAESLEADICLVPAAISDYAPSKAPGKIPSRQGNLRLDLKPTTKVLPKLRTRAKVLVGFKAEAGVDARKLKERAIALLKEADLDLIVANDVARVGTDVTSIFILDRAGRSATFEGTKALAAETIWRSVIHGVPG